MTSIKFPQRCRKCKHYEKDNGCRSTCEKWQEYESAYREEQIKKDIARVMSEGASGKSRWYR